MAKYIKKYKSRQRDFLKALAVKNIPGDNQYGQNRTFKAY